MIAREDLQRIRNRVEHEPIHQVKVGVFDVDGVFRGKYVAPEKFLSALESGFGFCDVVFGWDIADQLYENVGVQVTGWHTGYPDGWVALDADTLRTLPTEPHTLLCIGDFDTHPPGADAAGGEPKQPVQPVDPRSVLKRIAARGEAMGYRARAAFEYEFFLFEETPHSVREKGYRDLRPVTPGMFGYSVLRSSTNAEFFHELLALCRHMRMPLEGLHTETGPGVLEAALMHQESLEAADRAALFKTFVKALAQRRGWMATFMAKWSNDYPGQSGHLHLSLWDDAAERNVFHDSAATHGMSPLMAHFLAGAVHLLPEWALLVAPTVNSYSRLVKGFWAPTIACWGVENRTAALRVIPGSAKAQRVEHRVCGADANPYLALAGLLAAGLHGIEQGLALPPMLEGNAYEQDGAFPDLPPDLEHAIAAFRGSAVARDWFGDAFVEHFAASREWELREYRRAVTDWELRRYFELI